MAKTEKAKQSDSKGKTKAQRHSARTMENKRRKAESRAARLLKAAERRASDRVNGRKASKPVIERREEQARRINSKIGARGRVRKFTRTKATPTSPTEKGEIQFGEKAKGHHVHQRNNGLARALTPKEFQAVEQQRQQEQQEIFKLVLADKARAA